MTVDVHEGGCLCGGLRYRARGEALRANACHCTFCQRLTGSQALNAVVFPNAAVDFEGPAPLVYEHHSDGSGQAVRVHACPRCATTLALTFARFPGVTALLRGTLDAPDGFVPQRHFFTRSAMRGTLLPAGVDCFVAYGVEADGTPAPALRHGRTMVSDGRGGGWRPADGDGDAAADAGAGAGGGRTGAGGGRTGAGGERTGAG